MTSFQNTTASHQSESSHMSGPAEATTGPWGRLGAAVADVLDIPRPRTVDELESLVNRLFSSHNFKYVHVALCWSDIPRSREPAQR